MDRHDRETPDSYYEASKNRQVESRPVAGELRADVVVIGGGLTGSSTALCLAEKGVSVALIESRHFGWGASGRSGGQIISGYSIEQPDLEKLVGLDTAKELWAHSLAALDFTRGRIEQHEIQCDLTSGFLHVGVKPRHASELERWAEHMDRVYEYSVLDYLDQPTLRTQLGSELYSAGVFDPGSGHLHPLNYSLGITAAARDAGAMLYDQSPVTKITQSGSHNVVHTANGSIRCDAVVYACNAYLDGLQPQIQKKFMAVGTYIVATEPLGETVARALISSNAAVVDTNHILDYYRMSADHRLLFGGRVSLANLDPGRLTVSLQKRMLRVFPRLAGVKLDYSWGGYVAITQNHAPHVGHLPNNQFYAQGFSGQGMSLTGYVGSLLAKAVTGERDHLACFEKIPHRSYPGGRLLRVPSLAAAMLWHRALDAR